MFRCIIGDEIRDLIIKVDNVTSILFMFVIFLTYAFFILDFCITVAISYFNRYKVVLLLIYVPMLLEMMDFKLGGYLVVINK